MAISQKSKKRFWLFGGLILIPVFIAVFFYVDSECRYFKSFHYDLHADYHYAFPQDFVTPVTIEKDGFKWPSAKAGADTAFLKIAVRSEWTSIFCLPYIEVRYRGTVLHQYFEKTGQGVRYLNLSQVVKTLPSPSRGEKIVLKGHHIAWKQGASELYLFQNADIRKAKILVLSPHPDDAEIAAFGLYNDQDAYVVTITAGEGGKSSYKKFFKDPKQHSLFKGKIRTWDSIVIPFWGGVPPQKCLTLGYFDETLSAMFRNPTQKVASLFIGTFDMNTFRQYNVSDLLPKDVTVEPTWNNLVGDLEHLLAEINPSIIVTPSPVTDSHPDHQLTTLALLEALERTPTIKGSLYFYTVHSAYSTRWPLGTSSSVVSLPPFFSGLPFFEKIYSHHLSPDAYLKKYFAMDDMHALRPVSFLSVKEFAKAWPVFQQALYLHWKGVLFTRRYLRIDELFFVAPAEQALHLRKLFLKNLPPED